MAKTKQQVTNGDLLHIALDAQRLLQEDEKETMMDKEMELEFQFNKAALAAVKNTKEGAAIIRIFPDVTVERAFMHDGKFSVSITWTDGRSCIRITGHARERLERFIAKRDKLRNSARMYKLDWHGESSRRLDYISRVVGSDDVAMGKIRKIVGAAVIDAHKKWGRTT